MVASTTTPPAVVSSLAPDAVKNSCAEKMVGSSRRPRTRRRRSSRKRSPSWSWPTPSSRSPSSSSIKTAELELNQDRRAREGQRRAQDRRAREGQRQAQGEARGQRGPSQCRITTALRTTKFADSHTEIPGPWPYGCSSQRGCRSRRRPCCW